MLDGAPLMVLLFASPVWIHSWRFAVFIIDMPVLNSQEIVCKLLDRVNRLYYLILVVYRKTLNVVINDVWKLGLSWNMLLWLLRLRKDACNRDLYWIWISQPRILICFKYCSCGTLGCMIVSSMLWRKSPLTNNFPWRSCTICRVHSIELMLQSKAFYNWIRNKLFWFRARARPNTFPLLNNLSLV